MRRRPILDFRLMKGGSYSRHFSTSLHKIKSKHTTVSVAVVAIAERALVQIVGSAEMLLINMDTLLIEEGGIPNGGRSGVLEPESAEVELPLANAMHQFDA